MGLQKRASLYSGLGWLFLVGILVFIGVWAVRETTERSLNERVAVVRMVARGVDQDLLTAINELERLAVMVDLEDEDTLPEEQVLDNLYAFSGTFSHLFLVDSTGKLLGSQPPSISEGVEDLIAADSGISQVLNTSSPAFYFLNKDYGRKKRYWLAFLAGMRQNSYITIWGCLSPLGNYLASKSLRKGISNAISEVWQA